MIKIDKIADDYGRHGVIFYFNWMKDLVELDNDDFADLLKTYFYNCLDIDMNCNN